jgi:hypothetical protein
VKRLVVAMTGSILALSVLLAGCGNNSAKTAPAADGIVTSSSVIAPQPAATSTAPAFISKTPGQKGGVYCPDGSTSADDCAVVFSLDKITVSPKCSRHGTKADAGNTTLVLSFTVAVGSDTEAAAELLSVFNPFSFQVRKGELTRDATPGYCTDTRIPNAFGVGQKYKFDLEIQVPEPSGVLMLTNGPGGWTWTY